MTDAYTQFLARKSQDSSFSGFAPLLMPDFLYDFQAHLVDWALRKGKAALFEDCGMGKTPQQLVWADNIVRKTNKRVLILAPLAVGPQTVQEGQKFGIAVTRSRDGALTGTSGIWITNYDQLHHFNSQDFVGVVADESSCLKHFTGATQQAVTRFLLKIPYRLLCTATPSPNDYHELGTSSEALGALGYSDMLTRFFVMDEAKRHRINDVKLARGANTGAHFARLAYRVSQQLGRWRLKGHAQQPFWRWVCSWARACRMPSDLGFEDALFHLPPLHEREHILTPVTPPQDMLFTLPAFGLAEERDERRRTLRQRCEYAASLVDHGAPAVVWCHWNAEGDLLERLIPESVQIAGVDSDADKECKWAQFLLGERRVLITKPTIGAWGINLQHCAHVVTFVSHSFEQYYQSIRRCWRFGQHKPVVVDVIATTGEQYVRDNMARKAKAADLMFAELVAHMQDALHLVRQNDTTPQEVPSWL